MASGQRRNDPKATDAPTAAVEAATDAVAGPAPARADDGDDIRNSEFAEQVRKALNVGTNREAVAQLAPYFAGLAKP